MSKLIFVDDSGNTQELILPEGISLTVVPVIEIVPKTDPLYPIAIATQPIPGWDGNSGYINNIAPGACGAPNNTFGVISSIPAATKGRSLGARKFIGAMAPGVMNITGIEISFIGVFCPNATDTDYVELSQIVPCYNVVNSPGSNIMESPVKLTADPQTVTYGGQGNLLGLDPVKFAKALAGSYYSFVGVNFAYENKSPAKVMSLKIDAISIVLYYDGNPVPLTPSTQPAPTSPPPPPTSPPPPPTSPPPPPTTTTGDVPSVQADGMSILYHYPMTTELAAAVDRVDISSGFGGSDETVFKIAWNFDDGSNGFGADGRHPYDKAGTYNITGSINYKDGHTVPFGPLTVKVG